VHGHDVGLLQRGDDLDLALEKIDAGRTLLIIDACQSGAMLDSAEERRGPLNSRGIAQIGQAVARIQTVTHNNVDNARRTAENAAAMTALSGAENQLGGALGPLARNPARVGQGQTRTGSGGEFMARVRATFSPKPRPNTQRYRAYHPEMNWCRKKSRNFPESAVTDLSIQI
jgi:hypothetical protein